MALPQCPRFLLRREGVGWACGQRPGSRRGWERHGRSKWGRADVLARRGENRKIFLGSPCSSQGRGQAVGTGDEHIANERGQSRVDGSEQDTSPWLASSPAMKAFNSAIWRTFLGFSEGQFSHLSNGDDNSSVRLSSRCSVKTDEHLSRIRRPINVSIGRAELFFPYNFVFKVVIPIL